LNIGHAKFFIVPVFPYGKPRGIGCKDKKGLIKVSFYET
jgi:hypothetical protein